MNFTKKRLFKDKDTGRIMTLGEINEENVNYTIADILDINDLDNGINVKKREPIKLIISSGGGEVYRGLGLIDVIINSETPIHTICYGLGMSMALPILAVGHHRVMSSRSTLMYHEIAGDLGYIKLTEYVIELNEYKRINSIYEEIILERTKITRKQINNVNRQKKEWYISPNEALELGIIDEII